MNIETKWGLSWTTIPEICDENDFPDINETVFILIENDILGIPLAIEEQVYYPVVRYARLIKNVNGNPKYKWMLMDCQEDESCYVQQDETVVAWRYLQAKQAK